MTDERISAGPKRRPPLEPKQILLRQLSLGAAVEACVALTLWTLGQGWPETLLLPLGFVAALAILLHLTLARVSPVFRAIDRTPPSPAALQDLYRLPGLLSVFHLLLHGTAAVFLGVFDAAGSRLQAAFLLLAMGGVLSTLAGGLARRWLYDWLYSFKARELETELRFQTSTWLRWSIGGTLFGAAALACFANAWMHAPLARSDFLTSSRLSDALLLVPFLAGLCGWSLAVVLGRRIDRSLLRLAARTREDTGATWPRQERFVSAVGHLAMELDQRSQAASESASEEDNATQSIRDLQLQKMLFMASTGHDLRSPLNSILGFSELLLSEPESLTQAQQESIRAIIRSGEELLNLLKDILESARIAAGRLDLARDWVPAVEILTAAVESGHRSFDRDKLRIEAELQPGLPPVFVDRGRILQALGCLLRHAGRSMDSGVIDLKARVRRGLAGPELQVDVVDSSEGLRPEDREKIFEAFHEISLPSGKRLGGLGLALSLTKSLVTAHGGQVSANNTPGVGTTFTIAIPVGRNG